MHDAILVPTEREIDDATVDYAIELARSMGATIHALNVVETSVTEAARTASTVGSEEGQEALREAGEEATNEIVARAADAEVGAVGTVLEGEPEEEIIEYAEDAGVDAIVMGSRGHDGVASVLLGSVTEQVVRRSDLPVVVTPREPDVE